MAEFSRAIFENWFGSGGEMGALIRSHLAGSTGKIDSSLIVLGSVETWSPSLKTALNILLNTNCPMFLVWGMDRTLFYNDAYSSWLQENNTSIPLGRSINQCWPEAWQAVRCDVEQVFATGQSLQKGYKQVSLSQIGPSSVLLYTWCYSALWDETGQVGGVFATGCNDTVRQARMVSPDRQPVEETQASQIPDSQTLCQTKAALRQSEARFQAFMRHSPAAAWIVDQAGHLLYLSPTYFRMFQIPQQEVIGKPIQAVYGEEFAQQFLENNRQVFETGQVVETIETAPRPDGSIGSFLGLFGICRGIH